MKLAELPTPEEHIAPADQLDTVTTFGQYIRATRPTVEQLVRDGMPCVDIGTHDPRRRRKRLLRIDRAAALRWLQERGR